MTLVGGQHSALESAIADAREALRKNRQADGHWVYELEADVTITAECILLRHFLNEIDVAEEQAFADYIRKAQGPDGGWPLFAQGAADISATVKAYYALKIVGDPIDSPHMRRARELILSKGGAARANVFTRIALALFEQVPWRAVPVMPVEIMMLPRWFPFHLSKISYWSRTVIVPMLILTALRAKAANPRGVGIEELFVVPPYEERTYIRNVDGKLMSAAFIAVDGLARWTEPVWSRFMRKRAIKAALDFMGPRMNGEDGLGAIFPAMANAVMAFHALGYPKDDPAVVTAKRAIGKLISSTEERTYCQPCLSPVWDTALAMHAMLEAGEPNDGRAIEAAAQWLLDREIKDVEGDWAWRRPGLKPGGWAFQYYNDFYPDVDDTAVVAMALHRADPERYAPALARAADWVLAMQSENGGWGAFDADNTHYYLNHIPFADHGALLDPPTVDVTARCIGMLAQMGYGPDHQAVRRGVDYLKSEQESDGSWFGRWGVNHVYGTWSALCALNAAGEASDSPCMRQAVSWLEARQRADGGWGEDCATYWAGRRDEAKDSTPSQTAWAVLGLMAAGEVRSEAVSRGIAYLEKNARSDGLWHDDLWTGVGFPRVFYLKYHGYAKYFPLWALARYQTLATRNDPKVEFGL